MRKFFGVLLCIIVLGIGVLFLKQRQSSDLANSRQESYEQSQAASIGAEAEANAEAYSVPDNSHKILLVNSQNPLPENYFPEKLVNLYDYSDRHFELASSGIQLEESVYKAAEAMFAAAAKDGVQGFIITSGYRDREEQSLLADTSASNVAAAPGQSEHETGLAFDVTAYGSEDGFNTTEQFEWLLENCWDYGFILRYPEGKEDITGITYEPWHYRYVGLPYSQIIHDSNLTLEEYLMS